MRYRRERPRCRKILQNLMLEYNCTLEELLHHDFIFLSDNLRVQARKMIEEGKFHTSKELSDFEEKVRLYRAVGLIKWFLGGIFFKWVEV